MSRPLRNWMWTEALQLLDEAERLHRRFFVREPASWEPPVDVIETARSLVVRVVLPGVDERDVAVSLEPGLAVVSALRPFPACEGGARLHRVEIPYGRFERRIALPEAIEYAGSRLENGCLTLTFAKKEAA